MQVSLNVYDVTNTANENTNGMITRLNSITRELNLGGVFHGAVQLEDLEWSFGYCESGTGVYCCRARSNSLYTFREHIELGTTLKTKQEIREILSRFKRTWPGTSYDLLQRNCCHFCEELCVALDVPSPPVWLNRFAQGADATVKFTNEASALAKRVSSNITQTAQQSALWLRELSQRVMSQISLPSPSSTSDSGAASGDEGGDVAIPSPLYARSTSPGTSSDPGVSRREGSGMGRLTSRLRPFGASPGSALGTGLGAGSSGLGGGGDGGGSLPSSTPSSSCETLSAAAAPPSAPSPSALSPALASLRQKWQELEASAGDGTKQFLFGLIKTRQARLVEDDTPPSYGCSDGAGYSATHGSQGVISSGASWGPPRTSSSLSSAAAATGFPATGAAGLEATQPPTLQVMNDALLPPELMAGTPAAAAAAAEAAAVASNISRPPSASLATQSAVRQELTGVKGPEVGLGVGRTGERVVAGGANVQQHDVLKYNGPTTAPVLHLLDM